MAETARRPDFRKGAHAEKVEAQGPSAVNRLLARFYLRFHIALILLWSFSAGLLLSKMLLWAGVHSMLLRYPAALLVSYGAFFLGIRIWLAYVGAAPLAFGGRNTSRVDGVGNGGSFDLPSWRGSGSGSALRGGGGDFGGGGASASFASESGSLASASSNANIVQARTAGWFSGGGGGGTGGGLALDLGDGDSWWVILLLILVAALLSSVFGAVIYLVYSAPVVLADVAFQAMLAGGLVKSARRWRDACWEKSLLKRTWIPFAIVFVLAMVTAALASKLFPSAHTLPDVIRAARGALG